MLENLLQSASLMPLLAALALTTAGLHILFSRLRLRRRLAPRMQWWTPAVVMLLFVGGGFWIIRLTGWLDPAQTHLTAVRIAQGIYLGVWLACVPVFSPNKRWDKH